MRVSIPGLVTSEVIDQAHLKQYNIVYQLYSKYFYLKRKINTLRMEGLIKRVSKNIIILNSSGKEKLIRKPQI